MKNYKSTRLFQEYGTNWIKNHDVNWADIIFFNRNNKELLEELRFILDNNPKLKIFFDGVNIDDLAQRPHLDVFLGVYANLNFEDIEYYLNVGFLNRDKNLNDACNLLVNYFPDLKRKVSEHISENIYFVLSRHTMQIIANDLKNKYPKKLEIINKIQSLLNE